MNVPAAGDAKAIVNAGSVQAARLRAEQALKGRGRVVLRPSGTEPVIRVTIEAQDPEEVKALVAELAGAVESAA